MDFLEEIAKINKHFYVYIPSSRVDELYITRLSHPTEKLIADDNELGSILTSWEFIKFTDDILEVHGLNWTERYIDVVRVRPMRVKGKDRLTYPYKGLYDIIDYYLGTEKVKSVPIDKHKESSQIELLKFNVGDSKQ